jgi:hypothetical protein
MSTSQAEAVPRHLCYIKDPMYVGDLLYETSVIYPSSSCSITNLGQCGLFQSQQSCLLIVSWVVIQVVIFLLDDKLNVVLGACSPPFYECVGTSCVCVHKVFLLRVTWSSKISSFLLWSRRMYPAVHHKYFIYAVQSLFLSHYLIVQISLPYKRVGRADVLYNFSLVLLWSEFSLSVLFKSPSI